MIRVLVVADSGTAMATVTETLWSIAGVDIAGYASGRNPVESVLRALDPDVAVVDQMGWTGVALDRIREVRRVRPHVGLIALGEPEADWAIDALHAGADAVVPRDLQPATLAVVLREVMGDVPAHGFDRSAA
jgi:DNA-binding NarL/FixJ family response regulator